MTDKTIDRPVGVLRGEERVFFERAREGVLVFQRCTDCDGAIFPLRTLCSLCGSVELILEESTGRGEVFSYTIQYRAKDPFFKARSPHVIVLVELEEGFRLLANLVDVNPDEVRIGVRVKAAFSELGDDLGVVDFVVDAVDEGEEK